VHLSEPAAGTATAGANSKETKPMNHILVLTLSTIVLGLFYFCLFMPAVMRGDVVKWTVKTLAGCARYIKNAISLNTELGGYVHDTAMSQIIPNTLMMATTGTWTRAAGAVAGTIAYHKAATAETSIITIPIMIPSNSVAGKGAYLKSIEIDYEVLIADLTSLTPVVNKVTRGADLAVAVVAAQTFTQSPTLALSAVTDQHKLIITITTPFWVANTEYVLLQLTAVAPATTTLDFLDAVANWTLRA
jgi:hypothetical protein